MTETSLSRRSFGLGALAVGAAALAACSEAANGAPTKSAKTPAAVATDQLAKVTLKIGDQKAGLQALLRAAGELDQLPFKVSWSTFTSGPPLLEATAAGAVDIGGVGNTPPIFAAAAGSPIRVVSASQDDGDGDRILAPRGSTLRTVAELKGKTVAVAKGSSAHGHLILQLNKVGLKPTDLKIVFVPPSDGYAALTARRVEAWAVWDPYAAQATLEAGAVTIASGKGVANGLGFQVASVKALEDPLRNAAIRELVVRTTRARHWAQSHPDRWATTYAAETGLDPKVARATARRGRDLPVVLTPQVVSSEQKLVDALAAAKVIPAQFTFADFVDHRFDAVVTETLRKA